MATWHVQFIFTFDESRKTSIQYIINVRLAPECFESEERMIDEINWILDCDPRQDRLVKVSMCIYGDVSDDAIPAWYWDCSGKIYF